MGKQSLNDKIFNLINYTIMVLLIIVTLYPFLHVLAVALNDAFDSMLGGITIFPRKFTWVNFTETLKYPQIYGATIMTVLRTIIGTTTSVLATAIVAYVLHRQDFFARKFVTILFVLTMYVGAGLIPHYLLIRQLGLMNNFLVYILPDLINPFYLIVIRSYLDSNIPEGLMEAAKIDGANDFVVFWRIVLPLCMPVIATVALFTAVGHWNSWFDTYIYCSGNPTLSTLQFELQKILTSASSSSSSIDYYSVTNAAQTMKVTPDSLRMAMTIIVTLPILCVYPFIQRYFIHGWTIGAVKG